MAVARWSYRDLHRLMRWSVPEAAAEFGVHERTVDRWLADGVSSAVADRLAVHVGFHPANVWPTWYDEEEAA